MVTSECLRCGGEFSEEQPRAFCPPCRPLAVAEAEERHLEALAKFYLEHPDAPMPGDTVRRLTSDEKAFKRSVMGDLGKLT